MKPRSDPPGVAIVGMACRFPGAADCAAYWRNLSAGIESITPLTDSDLLGSGVSPEAMQNPAYVKAAALLENIAYFDAPFFEYSPGEARLMDPQQRLLLQVAWEAFEDAGYRPGGTVGVFVGCGGVASSYLLDRVAASDDLRGYTGSLSHLGNDKDFASTRISYKLDLTGPSVNIQTACSTSLVALHLACQSILSGECDMALAGASAVRVPQRVGYQSITGGILSRDGHCRAFDADASGTIFGSGVGVVLLKDLSRAIDDRDQIYAIIRGTAINNDGANKVSYTASSVQGQTNAMVEAMAVAQVDAGDIEYVECHGTGTIVGDPLELAALSRAFRVATDKRQFCAIGSVKSNFGHLEQCAGMAGLIKAALALHYGSIPRSLHFRQPNPKFDFDASAFFVNTESRDWLRSARRRYAGVNSLGLGGTNAFAVLEEAPPARRADSSMPAPHIIALSAKTADALSASIERQKAFLDDRPDLSLADISRSLTEGRHHFPYRFAAIAETLPDLQARLNSAALQPSPRDENPKLAFLFSGQASQYVGMAEALYCSEPCFRETFDRCGKIFEAARGHKLQDVVFGPVDPAQLDQTCNTQPALYAVQCGLVNLWRSWGAVPDMVLGHSIGEYAAAFCAGVHMLEDGFALVLRRSELMQALPAGSMAAIAADPEHVFAVMAELACDDLSIAALNAPHSTVISGSDAAVARLLAAVNGNAAGQKLSVSHAFHSPLMRPAMKAFGTAASRVAFSDPKIEWVSTLTGEVMPGAPSANYWVEQSLKPVRFSDAIRVMAGRGVTQYLEIGPGHSLLALGQQCVTDTHSTWLASLRKGHERKTLLESLAELYRQGRDIDWTAFNASADGRRISLPTYSFEKHRYWLDGDANQKARPAALSSSQSLSGTRLHSASDDAIFEAAYGFREFPFLRDHVVYDQPVLPFTAGLCALWDAARSHDGAGSVELSGVQYHRAMIVPEEAARPVQLILSPDGSNEFKVRLSSLDGDAWQSHITGRARPVATNNKGISIRKSIDAIKSRCRTEIEAGDYYLSVRKLGLAYGDSFRGIERIYHGSGEALTRVTLPSHLALPDAGQHPALLDACLHIYPALVPNYEALVSSEGEQFIYLPIGVEQLGLHGAPRRSVWVHARRRQHDAVQRTLTVDLDILDDDGGAVAVMDGLVLKMLPPAVLAGDSQADVRNWLYRLEWRRVAESAFPENASMPRSSWLILADNGGVGELLAAQLTRRGDTCRLFHAAHAQETTRRMTTIKEMSGCLVDAISTMSQPNLPPLRGILDLWSLNTQKEIRDAAALDAAQCWITGGAAAVFRALAHAPLHQTSSARVWIATRNAVAAESEGASIDPMAATVWGLGRSAALEHPNVWGGLIDLPADAMPQAAAEILFQRVLNGDGEDQVAVRNGKSLAARLTRMPVPHDKPAHFDSSAHYLITGGLGAVGSELAKWLVVRHGVKHLVLVSRQGEADPRASGVCNDLKALGADVVLYRADVTRKQDLAALLSYLKRKKAVLKGVFHCAGLLDDGILAQMDWQKFSRVMQPKVAGAWLLDKFTRGCPLDHFVLFSSVLSIIGAAGQANYAAANSFLDSLATRRRQDGLPALALNWGPWAAEGLATASGGKGRAMWAARGTRYIETKQAWAAFDALIGRCDGHACITITDWPVFFRQFETVPPLYELLRRESPVTTSQANSFPDTTALRAKLAKAPAAERRDLIADFVGKAVSVTLGIDGPIDSARSLQQYGLDSLMSVTLINRLESALGLRIPMAFLIRGPSLAELVNRVIADRAPAADAEIAQEAASPHAVEGKWLTFLSQRTNLRLRLFCFPFAGGGSAVYRTWVPSIRDDIEVIAIEPPGRLNRIDEQPVSDIDAFVDHVTDEVRDKLDRPFAFFGHCLGGLTMYETARRLMQTTSHRPSHLFVSGARPPDRLADQGAFEQNLLRDLMKLAGFHINLPTHAQPDDVFSSVIQRFNILATEQLLADGDLRELMLPVIRAEFRMANNYIFKPEPPWDIPITCFYARDDPYVTREQALGWGRFTNNRLQTHVRAGAHFAVVDDMTFITGVINQELQI